MWLVRSARSPSINSLTLPAQELNGNTLVQTNLSWRIIAKSLIEEADSHGRVGNPEVTDARPASLSQLPAHALRFSFRLKESSMPRLILILAFLVAVTAIAGAQSVAVYQTTPDLAGSSIRALYAAFLRQSRPGRNRAAHHGRRRAALPGDRRLRRVAHRLGCVALRQKAHAGADRCGFQECCSAARTASP